MLSGETAAGKYPIEAVGTMVRIATYIEAHQLHDNTQLLQQEAAYNAEYDALMETWETLSEAIAAEEGT